MIISCSEKKKHKKKNGLSKIQESETKRNNDVINLPVYLSGCVPVCLSLSVCLSLGSHRSWSVTKKKKKKKKKKEKKKARYLERQKERERRCGNIHTYI